MIAPAVNFAPLTGILQWQQGLHVAVPWLNGALLLASILFPLVAGFALLLAGPKPGRALGVVAGVAFLIPALFAVWLWSTYAGFRGEGEYLFRTDISTGLDAFGISLKLGLNGISAPLFLMAGIVGLAAGLFAIQSGMERMHAYLGLLLIMLSGLLGLFASIDLFFFYFFHEFALIPTFIMIGIWGGRGRKAAAMEMTIYLTLGALLSLTGLIAVYVQSGLNSFDMITLREHLAVIPLATAVQQYAFGLLLFGFGILVSLWPFHTWAPRGYAAAPASAAMLHAGVLKKFGLYGLVQVAVPLLPDGALSWSPVLIYLALGNVLIIGFVTLAQRDLKRMIGYSSVMHMGYIFLGIVSLSTVGIGAAVFLMFAHGLSIALLFLLSASIENRTGTTDLFCMGGLARQTPVLAGFFVAAVFAAIGLPGFANFWGELAVFIAVFEFEKWLGVLVILGIIISAVYGLRAVAQIFYGEASDALAGHVAKAGAPSDLKGAERAPALLLLLALMFSGFLPGTIADSINRSVEATYRPVQVSLSGGSSMPAASQIRRMTATSPGFPWESLEVRDHHTAGLWLPPDQTDGGLFAMNGPDRTNNP